MLICPVKKLLHYSNKYFYNYCHFRKNNLKPPWRILFFGTDEFSLASLKAIYDQYKKGDLLTNLEVVTSVKRKRNAVEKFASEVKLTIHDWPINPENCDRFHVGLVVSFGHLIPKSIITSFPLGMLNVHASLLPRWRGAAPIIYALANGDEETGVTIMKIKPHKFDIGEIIQQESVTIPCHTKLPELYSMLADLGAQALIKTLEDLPTKLNHATPQPENGVTLAPRVNAKMACINWNNMSARDICNLERALTGMFHLSTKFNDIPVKLHNVAPSKERYADNVNRNNNEIVPGFIIYNKNSKTLRIQCADGNWISVEKIAIPGKKMSAADFNNGFLSKQMQNMRIFR